MSEKVDSSNVANPTNEDNADDAVGKSSATSEYNTDIANAASLSLSNKRIHTETSSYCLLLQDTTRSSEPAHLQVLFSHFKLKVLTKAEILFQLVYLVALESGFAEQITYQKCLSQLYFGYSVVTFFDARNVLLLVQHKPTYSFDENNIKFRMQLVSIVGETETETETEAESVKFNFILSGIVTGDFMIVTLTPMHDSSPVETFKARSICLPIPRYVLGTAWKDNNKPLNKFLAKMDDLVYNLRENVFLPIQNERLAMMGIELYPALLGIPGELYDNIFHCLSPNQLRILANVNKQLNQLVVNSKHYSREPIIQNRFSFLSPSQSRSSFRF